MRIHHLNCISSCPRQLDELTAHGHALRAAHRESAPEAVADVEAGAYSADIERRAIAQARRESTAPSASPPQNAR
jgi:hypothetical protein